MTETRTDASRCSCGCGALPTVGAAEVACKCGCECCNPAQSRDEEIAELHRLLDSIQVRLAELSAS